MKVLSSTLVLTCFCLILYAQTGSLTGQVSSAGKLLPGVSITLLPGRLAILTDSAGQFHLSGIPYGRYQLTASSIGYIHYRRTIAIHADTTVVPVEMETSTGSLDDVVVTGTLKAVSRSQSPIPVEVYTPAFFRKNPTPNLFEAISLVNGIRPQLNCNICNTGDIHINGMEGPYTLILIDGMPIVSALSTVYGLSGIPNSMVERLEVVKGPAASLYGSEAMGGIINVITKTPSKAPAFHLDVWGTTWQELNTDAATRLRFGKVQGLLGINSFRYNNRVDRNQDGFTDIALQKRISVFNKWTLQRRQNRLASLGLRYVYEDRFGGQLNWNKQWRGSDSIYGESVYTNRFELFGLYQLPLPGKWMLQYSYNHHRQNSFYGTTSYQALQQVAFAQLYWDRRWGKNHNFLLGATYRYTYYDDNTPATAGASPAAPKNQPSTTPLPGLFVQDEWQWNARNTLLAGYRFDYDRIHGDIHSPRIAYKFSPHPDHTLRASFGSGFRVVNLFTEDHAALTGSRQVVIREALQPERSLNSNLNYVWKIAAEKYFINLDFTGFYSYFTNKIVGDYTTNPNQIIYDNLHGHAVSRGGALNAEMTFPFPLKVLAGITFQEVYQKEPDASGRMQRQVQPFAPRWSGNYLISYTFPRHYTVDLTGTYTGTMRLPVQPHDYRPEYAPFFMLANLQLTKKLGGRAELYGGLKNLFNFVPQNPLMRPFDPFDRNVNDPVSNPYGYTFDTEYNYAPLQGLRGFLGIRWTVQ